jgi:thiol-disulfide isomerase/thioredoxin
VSSTKEERVRPSRRVFPLLVAIASAGCTCDSASEPIGEERRDASAAVASASATAQVGPTPTSPEAIEPRAPKKELGWNPTKIDWQKYATGLARARTEKKPVCLVFYTEWCPHCRAYSRVFDDARVVEQSRDFVMIRIDADEEPELNKEYAPDGRYIPRTYFLAPDGTLDASLHAPRPKYRFFYDENDAAQLLGGMTAAAKKLMVR